MHLRARATERKTLSRALLPHLGRDPALPAPYQASEESRWPSGRSGSSGGAAGGSGAAATAPLAPKGHTQSVLYRNKRSVAAEVGSRRVARAALVAGGPQGCGLQMCASVVNDADRRFVCP